MSFAEWQWCKVVIILLSVVSDFLVLRQIRCEHSWESRMAQWKRAGPMTQRTKDRNFLLLYKNCEFFDSQNHVLKIISRSINPSRAMWWLDWFFAPNNHSCFKYDIMRTHGLSCFFENARNWDHFLLTHGHTRMELLGYRLGSNWSGFSKWYCPLTISSVMADPSTRRWVFWANSRAHIVLIFVTALLQNICSYCPAKRSKSMC